MVLEVHLKGDIMKPTLFLWFRLLFGVSGAATRIQWVYTCFEMSLYMLFWVRYAFRKVPHLVSRWARPSWVHQNVMGSEHHEFIRTSWVHQNIISSVWQCELLYLMHSGYENHPWILWYWEGLWWVGGAYGEWEGLMVSWRHSKPVCTEGVNEQPLPKWYSPGWPWIVIGQKAKDIATMTTLNF